MLASPVTETEAKATADLFKALSDPHRVKVINLLANSDDPICVCDIADHLEVTQPTASFHLKKLQDAGLLRREARGTWAYYSLNSGALKALRIAVGAKP